MLRDEEIERLRQVAVADPTQSVRLCDLLVAAGRAEEAVRICRAALWDRPDDVDLRLALGRALSAAGNLEEAQAALFDAVARKRRITRQNVPTTGGAGHTPPPHTPPPRTPPPHTPPPRTPPPQGEAPVPEPGAPTEILSGGTSRHIIAPTGRPLSGTRQSLRPLGSTGADAAKAPAPRKLPPLSPPSQRTFGPLPAAAPRFPGTGRPGTGPLPTVERPAGAPAGPGAGPGDRPHLDEAEAAAAAPEPVAAERTGSAGLLRREAFPAGRGVAPPATPSASPPVDPTAPPPVFPSPADPLPVELQEPVLPLPDLASLADGSSEDEPSLVSEVLAAAASSAHHIGTPSGAPSRAMPLPLLDSGPAAGSASRAMPLPLLDSGPAGPAAASKAQPLLDAGTAAGAAPGASRSMPLPIFDSGPAGAGEPAGLPAGSQAAPLPSAAAPAAQDDASLPVDLSPPPLLYDIEAAARRLLGPDALPQKAPPPAERDRGQLLFDQRRRRTFSGLWISLGLVSIGVLVGWATRTATTAAALKRRLAEGERLAATARYEDLRAARDLYAQAAQLAPHDALALARHAEAEARLCADHGEGTEDGAFILLRRAEHEAQRARGGRAAGPLRRAAALLALSRGEPCPTLEEAEAASSLKEDGDVAARCALQRGDVSTSLRTLTSGGTGSVDQLLWRGSLALSLGDLEEADHAYRTVLDLLPGHPRALLGRGMVQAERGAELQEPPIADGTLLGVVGESWLQLLRGLRAQRAGDEAAAARAIDLAERGARYDARLALWVGRARLDEGRVADAEAALRRAGRLSPSDPDLSVLDAEVALAKGHEDRVIRALLPLQGQGRMGGRLLSVLGRALYRAGRYREAQGALDRALGARPGDVLARSYRLLCRARLGAEREAFRELEGLAAGPLPLSTPHYALAVLAYERKDLERAAEEASKALARNPEASLARALRGRVLREQGKLAEGLADLERVAREAPALLLAHQILGRVYLDLGRAREARAELQAAVGSGRATLEDYAALLDATMALGLPAESEQVAREARAKGARAGRMRRAELLAASYKGPAQAQQAARELETDRRANARDLQLGLQTAAAWLRAGDPQAALEVYEALRGRAPLQALLGIGRAQLRQRKGEEAETAFRAALTEWQKAPYGPAARAEARGGLCRALLLRGGQSAEAAREAEAALGEDPELSDGYYCRARVQNERGQVAEALRSAERAQELDPTSMESCVLVGDLTYKSKQTDLARKRYEKCLEMAPSSPLARYVRGALSMIK